MKKAKQIGKNLHKYEPYENIEKRKPEPISLGYHGQEILRPKVGDYECYDSHPGEVCDIEMHEKINEAIIGKMEKRAK